MSGRGGRIFYQSDSICSGHPASSRVLEGGLLTSRRAAKETALEGQGLDAVALEYVGQRTHDLDSTALLYFEHRR